MDTTQAVIKLLHTSFYDIHNSGDFYYIFTGKDKDNYHKQFEEFLREQKDLLYNEYSSMIFSLNRENSNLQKTCSLLITKLQKNGYPLKFWKRKEELRLLAQLKSINKIMHSNHEYIKSLECLIPISFSPYIEYILMHEFLISKGFYKEQSKRFALTSFNEVWVNNSKE